jgi:hypothetical protein
LHRVPFAQRARARSVGRRDADRTCGSTRVSDDVRLTKAVAGRRQPRDGVSSPLVNPDIGGFSRISIASRRPSGAKSGLSRQIPRLRCGAPCSGQSDRLTTTAADCPRGRRRGRSRDEAISSMPGEKLRSAMVEAADRMQSADTSSQVDLRASARAAVPAAPALWPPAPSTRHAARPSKRRTPARVQQRLTKQGKADYHHGSSQAG